MAFPIKVCVVCSEEFELKPDKPGFVNRCPNCSMPEASEAADKASTRGQEPELAAARRQAMRDLLYRKDR